jgi:hypothetical protein
MIHATRVPPCTVAEVVDDREHLMWRPPNDLAAFDAEGRRTRGYEDHQHKDEQKNAGAGVQHVFHSQLHVRTLSRHL